MGVAEVLSAVQHAVGPWVGARHVTYQLFVSARQQAGRLTEEFHDVSVDARVEAVSLRSAPGPDIQIGDSIYWVPRGDLAPALRFARAGRPSTQDRLVDRGVGYRVILASEADAGTYRIVCREQRTSGA